MDTNDALLNTELRRDEGVRYSPYVDSVGVSTVGIGHNLKVSPIPVGWSYPLSDAQVNQLLASDLEITFTGLNKRLVWWRDLSYMRQRVVSNMAFNMGIDGLLTFTNTLAAMQAGKYQDAATGMLASKWAKQVGDRAKRLAAMMVLG
jgi:lysozyme